MAVAAFEDMNLLSSRDSELMHDPRIMAAYEETVREAFRQGTSGGGWDDVSWIGDWDIDLNDATSPGFAVVRQRRPLRAARARIVAVTESAPGTTRRA